MTGSSTILRIPIAAAVLLSGMVSSAVALEPIDGFVTPYRTINVATAETGIVREILVEPGDVVEPGQILARLDDELYASLVAIAQKNMEANGRLRAAETEQRIREERRRKLEELLRQGSARQEELERATADAEIASAQRTAIHEELAIKQLDYERARIQLERRTIRAPTHGVVLQHSKEPGEFIGQNDPYLMTIIQVDPLLAVFAVPSPQARRLRTGQPVRVQLPEMDAVVEGTVEAISPVVDGKSGTMRVEVRLNNPERRFLSGEPCSLLLDPSASHQDRENSGREVSGPAANGGGPDADPRSGRRIEGADFTSPRTGSPKRTTATSAQQE